MITFDPRSAEQSAAFDRHLDHLSHLVADMRSLRDGVAAGELAEAPPLLEQWAVAVRPSPCLVGLSTGHPELPGADRPIHTSDLWLLSTDGAWARTLSRWYRLRNQAEGGLLNSRTR